jgi:hypothetical protein
MANAVKFSPPDTTITISAKAATAFPYSDAVAQQARDLSGISPSRPWSGFARNDQLSAEP